MKKTLKIIFLTLILLLGYTNVYAEEVPVKELPKTYSASGYEYTIEGIDILIYEGKEGDDSNNGEYYLKGIVYKTIPLEFDDLSINPEYKDTTILDVPATMIDLNLNLTKEKVENYLTDFLNNEETKKTYFGELVVRYKLTKQKEEAKYMYNINFMRALFNKFSDPEFEYPKATLDSTITQSVNIIGIYYDKDNDKYTYEYETELSDEKDLDLTIFNYLVLSNNEDIDGKGKLQNMFMFYNVDNIDHLKKVLEEENSGEEDPNPLPGNTEEKKNTQTVEIPNTAATIPSYVYFISSIMIISGLGLITHTLSKE